jgi:hypothetical protein
MGIRGYSKSDDAPAFASDVLRVEIIGDTGLSLTVVDLPGLISVSDYEEGEADLELVNGVVDSYLKNPRSIILAVVQATNDIQNQRVIQRARAFDRTGERTVGIITKPDLVNRGTESRIAQLANNRSTTRLKLGFFLLKNPSPENLEVRLSINEWKKIESTFFSSAPWKDLNLDGSRVGVTRLRIFLEKILEQHIEREIPKVCGEIRELSQQTESALLKLGDERSSIPEQRKYLLRISMEYWSLIRAALDGRYREVQPSFFGNKTTQPFSNRLRARVHQMNTDFAAYMRDMGQKRRMTRGRNDCENSSLGSATLPGPVIVSKEKFNIWVQQVMAPVTPQNKSANSDRCIKIREV